MAAHCPLDADAFVTPGLGSQWQVLAHSAGSGIVDDDDGHKAFLADVEKVTFLAEERKMYPGRAPLTATSNVDAPLVRERQKTPAARYIVGCCATGIGFGLSAALVETTEVASGAGASWATLALCALVCISTVVSFVDSDTLFLDLPTLVVGGAIAWGCAVAACIARDDMSSLKAGVIVAVVWAAGLELTNVLYRLIRKTNGLGGGDTLIILTTAGVPGAVSGQPLVAFASVFAAAVLALLWHIPGLFSRTHTGRTAFAFGPFLCSGWLAGWMALHVGGIV